MCGLNDEMVSTERGWSLEWGHTSTRSRASKRPSFAIPTQDEQIKEGSARSLQASCEPRQSTCHAWQILCFHDFACYASCLDVVPFALVHGPLSSVGFPFAPCWFLGCVVSLSSLFRVLLGGSDLTTKVPWLKARSI